MAYLFTAYVVIWLALFLYLISLTRRQQELERNVDLLQQILEQEQMG
jgi:CcmD family protein